METIDVLLALIRIAVCGETPTEKLKNACTAQMLEQVYTLSQKHDLAHLAGQGVSKMNLPENQVLEKCKKAAMVALMRQTQQEYDQRKLYELLEKEEIFFLPLKGAVLRDLYPEPWQRTSCDIDILVKKEDMQRAADMLSRENWKRWEQSSNEITFTSPGNTVLELHHSIMEEHVSLKAKACLADLWQYAKPVGEKTYQMELPASWFYCCHLAHMAKHILNGGCGMRPFLDLWILEQKLPERKVPEESGLEAFANVVNKLSGVWFSGEPKDETSHRLQEYILSGGAYGNQKNRVSMQKVQKGGSGKYLWNRIFPSPAEMRGLFPVLQKKAWLMPIYYIVRPFRLLFGGKWRRAALELGSVKTETETERMLMIEMGLL